MEWNLGKNKMKNVVHLCDCMEFMKNLPDNTYDLAIADPWYGIGMLKNDTTGFAKRRFRNPGLYKVTEGKGDTPPSQEEFKQIQRISKNQIIWGGNYFLRWLGDCVAPYIWDKGTGANYFADGEMAWTSFKTGCLRIFKHQWCGMFKASEKKEVLIHPCQKPVAVYRDLLKRFAKPGMKIFSPYVGSGSDRIAAYDMGFDFEGCEISKHYFKAQENRFDYYKKQINLLEKQEIQKLIYNQGNLLQDIDLCKINK
jgi:site-specific DNA-methyltransferase (adenine-specific)